MSHNFLVVGCDQEYILEIPRRKILVFIKKQILQGEHTWPD